MKSVINKKTKLDKNSDIGPGMATHAREAEMGRIVVQGQPGQKC
jgi:hypothetical protein